MNEVFSKSKCCGCGACVDKCPTHSIQLKPDEKGFLYPFIEQKTCIDCGLCQKTCPMLNDILLNKTFNAYAASAKNVHLTRKSSSGGVFAIFAKYILSKGGSVFGSAYLNGFEVGVIEVTALEDLYKLQGSKYVQSNMVGAFNKIKKRLIEKKLVLFCGTGCQVGALRSFLEKDYENLFVIDLVCHGVPSNQMFNDYLSLIERKQRKKIKEYYFRDKKYGQDKNGLIVFENGKKRREISYKSSYYSFFLRCEILRDSCYSCKFANSLRGGDITLCDFWGVNIEIPEYLQNLKSQKLEGVSGVLANTDKGDALFSNIQEELFFLKVEANQIRRHNEKLRRPSKASSAREKIFELYQKKGYVAVDRYFRKKSRLKILLKNIYYKSPKFLKKIITRTRKSK